MKEISVRNRFGWALIVAIVETFLQSMTMSQVWSALQVTELPISLWRICALHTELYNSSERIERTHFIV